MKISQKKRKIGYTYSSVSGTYPFRGEKSICFESTLERDLLIKLEYDLSVVDVIEQPVTIEYVNDNGREVTYTPDFLVHYYTPNHSSPSFGQKSRLIEVKPNKILKNKWRELKPKFKQGSALARENGWLFHIYDETKIRGSYLDRLMFLERFKRRKYDANEIKRVTEYLSMVGHIRVDHLIESLYITSEEKGIGLGLVWHLLSKLVVCCDLSKDPNLFTYIWLNTEMKPSEVSFYE